MLALGCQQQQWVCWIRRVMENKHKVALALWTLILQQTCVALQLLPALGIESSASSMLVKGSMTEVHLPALHIVL